MGNSQSITNKDLNGKVAIVTGANTGIGYPTTAELAKMGCHIIMACRNPQKANEALEKVKAETGSSKIEVMELDLSSLQSVRSFAENFKAKGLPLHFLINNAGVMGFPERLLSKDGYELQFATNHLGHFLLTNLLLDNLVESKPSKVINLSSEGHRMGNLDWDNLQLEKGYGAWKAYGNSKLCNILFTRELQRRYGSEGISAYAVHPGFVATELTRDLSSVLRIGIQQIGNRIFAKTPESGALTTLHCCTNPEVDTLGGQYFMDCKLATPTSAAQNDESAKKLWEVSERLAGLAKL